MLPKRRIKHYIFVFLFSLALFSCKRTISDTTSDENVFRKDTIITNILANEKEKENKVTTEEKINDTELSSFLKELQVYLSQGQVTKIADTMGYIILSKTKGRFMKCYTEI